MNIDDAFTEVELEQVCGGLNLEVIDEIDQMKLRRQVERQSKLLETSGSITHSLAQTSKSIRNNLR